jgi:hypothetical protein
MAAYCFGQWHWNIVPIWLDQTLSHSLYDSFFNGSKDKSIRNFTFADHWFNTDPQVWHDVEGEPDAI